MREGRYKKGALKVPQGGTLSGFPARQVEAGHGLLTEREYRARRGCDARPGRGGRRGRPAALLSCRGSSSPKFPGSLPGRLACPAVWSRNPSGGRPKPHLPPHRDPSKAPSRPPGDNPRGCQDTQMPPGPGPPNSQFGVYSHQEERLCTPRLPAPPTHCHPTCLRLCKEDSGGVKWLERGWKLSSHSPLRKTEQASVVPVCEWGRGRVRPSQPTPLPPGPSLCLSAMSPEDVLPGDRWAGPSFPSPCNESRPGGPPVTVAPSLGHPRNFSSCPFSSGAPSPAAPGPPPLLPPPSSGHPVQTCGSFRSADSSNTGGKDGGRG